MADAFSTQGKFSSSNEPNSPSIPAYQQLSLTKISSVLSDQHKNDCDDGILETEFEQEMFGEIFAGHDDDFEDFYDFT